MADLLDPLEPESTPVGAVAARLVAAGVTGYRNVCSHCPLAVWLKMKTGVGVGVMPGGVLHGGKIVCPVPAPLVMFMNRFDLGNYPSLLRSTWK